MATGYSQFFTALTMGPGGGGGAGRAALGHPAAIVGGIDNEGIIGISQPFPAPWMRIPVTRAGNITAFHVNVSANTLTVASTYTVLVNGVATALTLSYLAGVIGFTTTSGPAAVVAGDLISIRQTAPAGAGSSDFSATVVLTQV